jgi:alcohol dehydrogenase
MRAVLINEYGVLPRVTEVAEPVVPDDGVVLRVEATGLCRSDWHGWQGHDPDIVLPHIPGHEVAGVVAEVGAAVASWKVGDRVTAPFVCACGRCRECESGNQQTCEKQQQPGFTYWGSFAEYVAIPWADINLVALPDGLSFVGAAALGCRFATAFRGLTQVGQVLPGEWVAVFGCGGVGLSTVMIAVAHGAHVVAVDTNPQALELAARYGATHTEIAGPQAAQRIRERCGGGADLAVDALGSSEVISAALASLRPRGRLVQLGLLPGPITLDMSSLVGRELRWLGSHGMSARGYPEMLSLVTSGAVRPDQLVTATIGLDAVPAALQAMNTSSPTGVTVIIPR